MEWYPTAKAILFFLSQRLRKPTLCYLAFACNTLLSNILWIESWEIGADWRDKFLVMEGQKRRVSEGRKMWTQSAMCWLYWLGACAKKSFSIPSFALFTLSPTTFFSTSILFISASAYHLHHTRHRPRFVCHSVQLGRQFNWDQDNFDQLVYRNCRKQCPSSTVIVMTCSNVFFLYDNHREWVVMLWVLYIVK